MDITTIVRVALVLVLAAAVLLVTGACGRNNNENHAHKHNYIEKITVKPTCQSEGEAVLLRSRTVVA